MQKNIDVCYYKKGKLIANQILGFMLLLVLAMISFQVNAGAPIGINLEMSRIGVIMRRVHPMIARHPDQLSADDVSQLLKDVSAVYAHVEQADKQALKKSDLFQLSYNALIEHLVSANNALSNNNLRYAQSLLRSATTLCSACHTQDQRDREFTKDRLPATFKDPLERADYYYMTRNYDNALAIYAEFLKSQHKVIWTIDTIAALERTLVIFLQIKKDPKGAIGHLQTLLARKDLDPKVRSDINQWLKGLKVIENNHMLMYGADFQTLEKYMKQYILAHDNPAEYVILREDKRVTGIWIRSLLHEYLDNYPRVEQVPMLLFWLAIIDRSLEYNIDYSLADLYLKRCITEYSKHAYARLCYNLYKDYIQYAYTGSQGTNIPVQVADELFKLGQLLEK